MLLGTTSAAWLALYAGLVVALVGGLAVLSHLLGERGRGAARGEPYEAGSPSSTPGRVRLSVQFYLVAAFFLIFDLEAVYLFAWAVVAREAGWPGFFASCLFVVVLLAALGYVRRAGALDWGPKPRVHRGGETGTMRE